MSEPFGVLVVCLGNVCRSPLAERLLRMRFDQLLGARADAVDVSSAGVRALVGNPMDERSAAELMRLGGECRGFVSTQLEVEAATSADLVLTATRRLRAQVLQEAPRALKRTFTIRELAALVKGGQVRAAVVDGPAEVLARAATCRGLVKTEEYDVRDPIGQPPEVHREVADLIDRDCTTIAQSLAEALLGDSR